MAELEALDINKNIITALGLDNIENITDLNIKLLPYEFPEVTAKSVIKEDGEFIELITSFELIKKENT